MWNRIRAAAAVLIGALFVLTLYGCGGGGGGSSTPTTPSDGGGGSTSAVISGTAAMGAAIANATITITGATGGTVTATTGSDGTYSVDVSSLTAPYLVKVDLGGGSVLYSVGVDVGTVNIHPLTDLILRMWYQSQGKTVTAAFANPAATPPPTSSQVAVIASVVKKVVEKWLAVRGIDPTQFDLISTSFDADGSGFDAMLDTLTVDNAGLAIYVDTDADENPEQSTDYTVDADGNISFYTEVTENGVTSSNYTTAVVPGSATAQAALNGVLTSLANMATVINSKGSNLAAADLSSFIDSSYLGRGLNADQFAAQLASDFAGKTLDSFTVDRIVDFDDSDTDNVIISVYGRAVISSGGTQVEQIVDDNGDGLTFICHSDGGCLLYGNQERARAHVQTLTERRMLGTGSDGIYYALEIQMGAPQGVISSATVAGNIGGTTMTNVALTKQSGPFTGDGGVTEEHFDLLDGNGWWYALSDPSQFPATGGSYSFDIAFTDTSIENATYTKVLGASTPEAMTLKDGVEASVGHSFDNSIKDQPVTLSWNLPVSFPIKSVEMYGNVKNSDGDSCDISGPDLAADATTGTITLPSKCNNVDVQVGPTYPSINVVVTGTSGETTDIWYAFQ